MTETATAPAGPSVVAEHRRVPPNFLAMAFGLAGLGEAWEVARSVPRLPVGVPDAFLAASAVVWVVLVTLYLRQGWGPIRADLKDPVLAPFTSLAVITPMIPGWRWLRPV